MLQRALYLTDKQGSRFPAFENMKIISELIQLKIKDFILISVGISSHRRCSIEKGVFRNFAKFTGKHLCQSLFFNKKAGLRPATLLKEETLAHVLSCEFCEISKNTFLTEHLRTTASEKLIYKLKFA